MEVVVSQNIRKVTIPDISSSHFSMESQCFTLQRSVAVTKLPYCNAIFRLPRNSNINTISKLHKFHRTAVILLPSTDDTLALPTPRAVRCCSSLAAYFQSLLCLSNRNGQCLASGLIYSHNVLQTEIFVCCGLAELDSRFTAQREVSRPQPARRTQAGMESTIRNAVSNNSNRETEMKLHEWGLMRISS